MKEKLLIVEHCEDALSRFRSEISSEYQLVNSHNVSEAFDLLLKFKRKPLVILCHSYVADDTVVDFIKDIHSCCECKNIPIIVIAEQKCDSFEKECMLAGAWDYVSQPYDQKVLLLRTENAINNCETQIKDAMMHISMEDELIGIYNKKGFINRAETVLRNNPDKEFVVTVFCLERLQLINSYFGVEKANELLKYIGSQLREIMKANVGAYGRIHAATFALMYENPGVDYLKYNADKMRNIIKKFDLNYDISLNLGCYIIEDKSESMEIAIDKATMAADSCCGQYMRFYAVYSDKMTAKMQTEQCIANYMQRALETGEFLFYLQPKYNINENRVIGAEALARWNHLNKEWISPGMFIPVFEKNGFIIELDRYIWEEVCKYIRSMLDKGREVLPISVNISRISLNNPEVVDLLCGLINKYNIPVNMLELELTESGYSSNPDLIIKQMWRLKNYGFTILLDDFGKGYSSLNVLRNLPVDILKMDMGFFEKDGMDERGQIICKCVIKMAKCIGITAIAEGVETEEQLQIVRDSECELVQGYYYAKPMPIEAYNELIYNNIK